MSRSIVRGFATVYYAPTAKRRFFTKRAAVNKEARAIILKHYPSENPCRCSPEYCGDCGDKGWSLEECCPDRFARYYRMLVKVLNRRIVEDIYV